MALQKVARSVCRIVGQQSIKTLACNEYETDIKSCDTQIVLTTSPKKKPAHDELVFGKFMSDHMLAIEWNKGQGWSPPNVKPFSPLHLHPNSGVFQYGGQIYEGMKAFYGIDDQIRIFRPDQNVARFRRSAERMALPVFDEKELLDCILDLVKLERDWIPKEEGCSLYIRPSLISLDTTSEIDDIRKALLFVILSPVGAYFKSSDSMTPVSLLADPDYVRAWPGGIGEYKAGGNYGATVWLQKQAQKKGCDQILWLLDDEVTEAGTMNMFVHWINENGVEELITPPLQGLILHGITRKSFIEIAQDWDEFLVSERKFTMQDIVKAADEGRIKGIFASGTACVVCPIGRILYKEKWIEIPCQPVQESLAARFHSTLLGIQYGRIPHRFAPVIC